VVGAVHPYYAGATWDAECHHHFPDTIDITDMIEDCMNLLKFLMSGHLPSNVGTAWWAYNDNSSNRLANLQEALLSYVV